MYSPFIENDECSVILTPHIHERLMLRINNVEYVTLINIRCKYESGYNQLHLFWLFSIFCQQARDLSDLGNLWISQKSMGKVYFQYLPNVESNVN